MRCLFRTRSSPPRTRSQKFSSPEIQEQLRTESQGQGRVQRVERATRRPCLQQPKPGQPPFQRAQACSVPTGPARGQLLEPSQRREASRRGWVSGCDGESCGCASLPRTKGGRAALEWNTTTTTALESLHRAWVKGSSEGSRGHVDSSWTRCPCDTAASWAWENALEYTVAVYCYISRGGARASSDPMHISRGDAAACIGDHCPKIHHYGKSTAPVLYASKRDGDTKSPRYKKILLTPFSPGKRCEATAQSALGWYTIDPVLVSQTRSAARPSSTDPYWPLVTPQLRGVDHRDGLVPAQPRHLAARAAAARVLPPRAGDARSGLLVPQPPPHANGLGGRCEQDERLCGAHKAADESLHQH
eukprot:scaffold103532_cov36-Phaeocystis_antarctica.AAC.1